MLISNQRNIKEHVLVECETYGVTSQGRMYCCFSGMHSNELNFINVFFGASHILGNFWCSAHISDVTLLWVILHPGICERSKQTNKQITIMICFLVWNFGLGFRLRILTWDLGQVQQMLQTYVVFHALELSKVLLGQWYILQMVLIGLHALVRIPTFCHLVYSSGKSSCQPFNRCPVTWFSVTQDVFNIIDRLTTVPL